MAIKVYALDQPAISPFSMSDRFRHDIAYFMTAPGFKDAPALASGEYWVRLDEARQWVDSGVIQIVSPLDANNCAEIEISEEHEDWLQWMVTNQIQHIRLQ